MNASSLSADIGVVDGTVYKKYKNKSTRYD